MRLSHTPQENREEKTMRKRLLSLLLVLACVLTLAVVPVVAAEPDPVQPTASVTEPTPTTDPEPSPEPSSEPSPEPTPAPSPEPSPVPTPSGPWYQAALDFARDHRILFGDPSGNMMPNDNATRAQMAAMLVRVFGCTASKDIAHFTDVSTTAWYYSELSTAAQMNIFNGYGDGTMGPNRSITRQEAMIVIARAFAVPDGTAADIQAFRDASSVGSWAVAKVGGLVKAGIVNGDNGSLHPTASITRAEIAQMLYNLGLQFCSDAAALPASGRVIYTGAAPLTADAFTGTLYLGGPAGRDLGGMNITGTLVVRTDPNGTVTVGGAVDTLAVAAEDTTVAGAGRAALVHLLVRGCTVTLAADKTASEYAPMLRGVDTLTTDPVPALSPECRAVDLYVTYRYFPSEYQTTPGEATLIWYVDGVQQRTRHYTLDGKSITPGFHVEESVWKRNMPAQHTVEILLMCGTDVIRTTFVVPVNNYTDAEYAQLQRAQYPYKLEVVRNQCTVLVYGLDMSGNYSILHHAFVCGPGRTTPIGTFRTPFKAAWHPLQGCWGQYCTQITGNYLFHSSPYNSPNKNDLSYRLYNQLGTVCSHGCVRLTVADAKWIYDNCPLGTTVSIYNASSLPVPKPSAPWLDISSPNRGWDPTDPDPANPWNK